MDSYFWQENIPTIDSPVVTWEITDDYIMAVIGATHRSRLGAVYNTPHPISYDAALRNFCTSLEELEDKGIESGEGEVMWCAYWMENTAMILYNNGGFYQCCMLKFEEGAEDNNITVFPLGDFNTTTEWLRAFGIKHIIRTDLPKIF